MDNMKQKIVIIGAGAFGGWTALTLLRKGYDVTLVDAWGAGHSRSSSGDETRVIRSVYVDKIYVEMVQRAMHIWRENEPQFGQKIFHEIGVLNLIGQDDSRLNAALKHFDSLNLPYEELSLKETKKRYPHFNLEDISQVVMDTEAGYLLARMGCHVVKEAFVKEGGDYRLSEARPLSILNEKMEGITLSDGSKLTADHYVFACGPWLGKLFPEEIGSLVRPTRQEVFYFNVPAGCDIIERTPVWCDFSSLYQNVMMYGIPAGGSDAAGRGFKIAEDVLGNDFDPDTTEREITARWLDKARHFMHHRFPILRGMPLSESRVCQYENTPDAHFLIDKLPTASNVWVMGGGSGHGYKMGASVGEMMTKLISGEVDVNPIFSFNRFKNLTEKVERR
jgi:glycine/D-amino acid oxidase-like deaminating enzyme